MSTPSSYLKTPADRGTGIAWTPEYIAWAETSADYGDTRTGVDLCSRLISDGKIKGDLDTRSDALLYSPVEFLASGDRRRSAQAVKALDANEDFWLSYPEQELRLIHQWGLLAGWAVAQAKWIYQGGRYTPIWQYVPNRAVRWDWPKRQWIFRESIGADDGTFRDVPITPGDGRWMLYTPFGSDRPWIYGLWRALSRLYLLKQYGIADWGNYSDRQGSGTKVVTGFEGTEAARTKLTTEMAALGRNASMVLRKEWDYKLVESVARTWEGFQAQIKLVDTAASSTILGQDIATGASSTAGTAKERVTVKRTISDASTLGTALREHGFKPWAFHNWGDENLAPWVGWDVEEPGDEMEDASVVQMACQAFASLKNAGAVFDEKAFLERFDIK